MLPRDAGEQATFEQTLVVRETLADISGYETLLRATPDDVASRTLLGSLLARVGRHADAEREYRAALALAPRDWLAHYNLGIEAPGARSSTGRGRGGTQPPLMPTRMLPSRPTRAVSSYTVSGVSPTQLSGFATPSRSGRTMPMPTTASAVR